MRMPHTRQATEGHTAGADLARVPSPVDERAGELLRAAFRRAAAGVAVITARDAASEGTAYDAGAGERGRPVGFTATSLTSVAADPALISFNVGALSSSWPTLERVEHIGAHILGEHQEALAATFARGGVDRFAAPTQWHEGPAGVPVLAAVPAYLICRIVARVPAGDHRVVIAEVVGGDAEGPGRPLLYHRGGYNALRH